ncbi:unnamed protein product [Closterium sp. Naga37s-1]|nr:unnamed protein product [Closterium sp. Naga37s-1]
MEDRNFRYSGGIVEEKGGIGVMTDSEADSVPVTPTDADSPFVLVSSKADFHPHVDAPTGSTAWREQNPGRQEWNPAKQSQKPAMQEANPAKQNQNPARESQNQARQNQDPAKQSQNPARQQLLYLERCGREGRAAEALVMLGVMEREEGGGEEEGEAVEREEEEEERDWEEERYGARGHGEIGGDRKEGERGGGVDRSWLNAAAFCHAMHALLNADWPLAASRRADVGTASLPAGNRRASPSVSSFGRVSDAASALAARMAAVGVTPNRQFCHLLVEAYLRDGRVEEAEEACERVREEGWKVPGKVLRRIVRAWAREGRAGEAEEGVREMVKEGVQLDVATCNSMIGLYARVGAYDKAGRVWEWMEENEGEEEEETGGEWGERGGEWGERGGEWGNEGGGSVGRKGGQGEWKGGRRRRGSECTPTEATYRALIRMYTHAGMPTEAIHVLRAMSARGLPWRDGLLASVIRCLAAAGRWTDAQDLFHEAQRMAQALANEAFAGPAPQARPELAVWRNIQLESAALGTSLMSGGALGMNDVELAGREELGEDDALGRREFKPAAWKNQEEVVGEQSYKALMSAYQRAGQAEKAEELLLAMEKRGIPLTADLYHMVMDAHGRAGNTAAAEAILD